MGGGDDARAVPRRPPVPRRDAGYAAFEAAPKAACP